MTRRFTIIGSKPCQTHVFLGQKGHLVGRSNHIRFAEGVQTEGVWCVLCDGDQIGMPSTIEALVYGSGAYTLPIRHESRLDWRFTFKYAPFTSALVTFDNPEQFNIKPQAIGRAFDGSQFEGIPSNLSKVARALSAVGFRVTGPTDLDEFHRHHLRTIILVRGKRLFPDDPQRTAVDGVKVELSYIVD